MEVERYYTLAEVSERTGKSVKTLYNSRSNKTLRLKTVKLGGSVRVKESDLHFWLKSCEAA
jgi:excisionase family DNA binding protein